MKRNRKYYKELQKRNFMNALRYIVLVLGIGMLIAQDTPGDFQYEISTLSAFYYFDSVTINGVGIESNDWVGAFNGDVCVGAQKWDTALCGNGICDVPVMGFDGNPETSDYIQAGDIPTFKIYDASEDSYYDAHPGGLVNITVGDECSAVAPACMEWSAQNFYVIENLNGGVFGCTDSNACNYNEDATMEDDSCLENDCAGECGGSAEVDDCGECGGDGNSCAVYVEGSITMIVDESLLEDLEVFANNIESYIETQLGFPVGTVEVTNIEISDIRELEVTIEFTVTLTEEELAETSFETVDDIEDALSQFEVEITNDGLDFVNGCTDSDACNYNSDANVDDGSCLAFDCAGDCGGTAVVDGCGTCDSDYSNDCGCVYDNCGVCNGDNSDCWFIDISSSIGNLGIEDNLNRIGMHEAAEDNFNVEDQPGYSCENCYKDELDNAMNPPSEWIDFYFPHPEWEEDIQEYFQASAGTDLRKDIRQLDTFDIPDLDNNMTIFVNERIYYIQQEWDIMIDTDPNVSYLPPGHDFVTLGFDFINQIPNSGGFTKVFFYKEVSGIGEIEEITEFGGALDPTCFSDYCIKLEDYDLLSDFRIILGTDTVMPSATIVSPLPNEIFAMEDDNLLIELDLDNPDMIADIELFFEVDGEISNAIAVDVEQFILVENNEYYEFLNDNISGNFSQNVNIYIEITDVAGGTVDDHPGGEYRNDLGPLTFSRNSINLGIETGWHLLAPPVQQQEELDNIFAEDAYECTLEGCSKISTANSGTGFYTRSYGDNSSFTFNGEVLSEFSTNLEPGWNLIGNPLVTSVDINTVIINYNGIDYKWPEASKYGIISPTPIIFDNENGGHIGTEMLSSGAGFWIYSYYGCDPEDNDCYDDVEISFIPSTTAAEVEASNYWNLSLFAIENNVGAYSDDRIGSEIVIGIHEDANQTIIEGEDQEIFPLSEMNIFDHYSDLSINNDGQTLLYKDIRSFHETSTTWNLEGHSFEPFDAENGIQLSWDFSGDKEPYDYYLNIIDGVDTLIVNMKDVSSAIVSSINFSADMSITAELKTEYIGCTNPNALNYNLLPNGDYCVGGTCLGGSQTEFCEITSSVSLALPEEYVIDQNIPEFELPISLDNPQAIGIEGLQFILEYDVEMVQLDTVALNENLNDEYGNPVYHIQQGLCTDCIPAELLVNVYFVGLREDFTDENGNSIWDEGEPFEDINYNGIYDDESFNGEGEILTLLGYGLPNTGTTTISFSSVQINENANAFGNSCEINMGLESLSVSGEIIYYKSGLPVSGGLISITQIDNLSNINSALSNEDGTFTVESLIDDKNYELLLERDEYIGNMADYFDGLSAVDASRIARHAGNLFDFSTKEKIAANVNFDYRCEDENGDPPLNDEDNPFNYNEPDCIVNGFEWVPNIEAGDAVLVAKYAAGINQHLNQNADGNEQCDPHWIFINPDMNVMFDNETCEDIPYEINLGSSISDLVFEGFRLGDVTGNWTAPLGRGNNENIVENPTVKVEVGQTVKLPLYLPNKVEIEGLDFTIKFDPEVFSLIGFNNNNSILDKSTYNTIINDDTPGIFKLVSYANSTLVNKNGLLGYIKFEVIGNSTRSSSISIDEIKINDIQEGGFLIDGNFESSSIAYGFDFQISAIPEVFVLNKNYPNPFNPSTNINFELPDDGDVQIFIYDIKGFLIDELVNGYMEAGYHNLKWDGSGKASGVYFIQMIADNGNYIKMTKMMLVK